MPRCLNQSHTKPNQHSQCYSENCNFIAIILQCWQSQRYTDPPVTASAWSWEKVLLYKNGKVCLCCHVRAMLKVQASSTCCSVKRPIIKWYHIPMQTECVLNKSFEVCQNTWSWDKYIGSSHTCVSIWHYFILGFVMCSVIQVYGQPRSLLAETKWKIALDNVECIWCEGWWKSIKKYSGISRTTMSTFVIYKILIEIKWRVFNEEVETVHWQQTTTRGILNRRAVNECYMNLQHP